jgi:hypothetical protein
MQQVGLGQHAPQHCFPCKCPVFQTLLTAGIQQLGWATLQCPFRGEEGVGDAPDSYAYDGKRLRKWNVKSGVYGQAWTTGEENVSGGRGEGGITVCVTVRLSHLLLVACMHHPCPDARL